MTYKSIKNAPSTQKYRIKCLRLWNKTDFLSNKYWYWRCKLTM